MPNAHDCVITCTTNYINGVFLIKLPSLKIWRVKLRMQSLHELRIGMEGIWQLQMSHHMYTFYSLVCLFSFSRSCLTPCFFCRVFASSLIYLKAVNVGGVKSWLADWFVLSRGGQLVDFCNLRSNWTEIMYYFILWIGDANVIGV